MTYNNSNHYCIGVKKVKTLNFRRTQFDETAALWNGWLVSLRWEKLPINFIAQNALGTK